MRSEPAYILVTPVKNEEATLPGLIQSIANQGLRPIAWFIVDDCSDDLSPQIISQAVLEYPWIHSIKLDKKVAYDIGRHVAFVYITGFEQALAYCEQNDVGFEYIALADADMVFPEDYFARCIDFLRDNPEFGFVSGRVLVRDAGGATYEESKIQLGDGEPSGTGRVWRKGAFAETGGYPATISQDSVSTARALLRGCRVKRLVDVVCYQVRQTGEKPGLWNGYFNRGERAYHVGATPLSIFSSIVDMLFISRPRGRTTRSVALLAGYCKSFLRREEQIDDIEIRRYFGSHKRVLRNYWLFLRSLKKRPNSHQP